MGGDSSDFTNKFRVPRVSETRLRWKTRGDRSSNAAQSFVREVDRNSQASLLNEKPLHFIHGPNVFLDIRGIDTLGASAPTVEVLVDIGDAIFPDLILPIRSWKFVLEHTVVAIERGCLAGFFFEVHLREKIADASLDIYFRILINIHATVLVQIDPSRMVDIFFGCLILRDEKKKESD